MSTVGTWNCVLADMRSLQGSLPTFGGGPALQGRPTLTALDQLDLGIVPVTPLTRKFMSVTAALSSAYPALDTSLPAWL